MWIEGKFPSLNEYIAAERRHRMIASNMKKEWTLLVMSQALTNIYGYDQQVPTKFPLKINFIIHEQNTRRDVDNVSAMVCKFILDGLVMAGALPDDSQKYINKIECDLVVDGEIGVEIVI
jgi:Holliday junction resolvase RusA-like endonuclease